MNWKRMKGGNRMKAEKTAALISILIGVTFGIVAWFMVRDSLVSSGHTNLIKPFGIGAISAVGLSIFISIKFNDSSWFKKMDIFIKKYGIWIGIALLLGSMIYWGVGR